MNDQLRQFARKNIKDGLSQLPDNWQQKFKMMYGRNNGERSLEDAIAMSVNDVVDEMADDKLDWAMTQIANSIKKIVTNGQ
jgi:hypothetical protein